MWSIWLKLPPDSPPSSSYISLGSPTVVPVPSRKPHSWSLAMPPSPHVISRVTVASCCCLSLSGFNARCLASQFFQCLVSQLPPTELFPSFLPEWTGRTSSDISEFCHFNHFPTIDKNHYSITILPVSLFSANINSLHNTAIENRQFSHSYNWRESLWLIHILLH